MTKETKQVLNDLKAELLKNLESYKKNTFCYTTEEASFQEGKEQELENIIELINEKN